MKTHDLSNGIQNEAHANPTTSDPAAAGDNVGAGQRMGGDMLPAEPAMPRPPALPSDLLTAEEAAEYMRCSERTIWDWKMQGHIACIHHGRYTRFARTDLAAALARWRVPARTELRPKRRMTRIDQEGRSA